MIRSRAPFLEEDAGDVRAQLGGPADRPPLHRVHELAAVAGEHHPAQGELTVRGDRAVAGDGELQWPCKPCSMARSAVTLVLVVVSSSRREEFR